MAPKLAKGEISVEEYIKRAKTSIDDLIQFAKNEKMDSDIIRELYSKKKEYNAYAKPFVKKQLGTIGIIINGKEVTKAEKMINQ